MSPHHQPETLQVGVEPLQSFTLPTLPPTTPPAMRTVHPRNDGASDRIEMRLDESTQAKPGDDAGTTD